MAALRMSTPSASALRSGVRSAKPVLPVRVSSRTVVVRAQASKHEEVGFQVGKVAALSTVATTWLMSGNANAATELATLAASDNRVGIIATLFVPVIGWVGFNILSGASAQLNKMNDKLKAVPTAVGLGAVASLLLAQSAEASTELATIAAGDNRVGIIATLFVPVLGWVGFNILSGATAQLNKMNDKLGAAPAALGLGAVASLLLAQSAEASELATIAAGDNRVGIIATLFVPVLGWVAFNILGAAFAQYNKMNDKL